MRNFFKTIIIFMPLITLAQITANYESINFDPTAVGETDTITIAVTSEIEQTIDFSGVDSPYSLDVAAIDFQIDETKNLLISFTPVEVGVFTETLTMTGSVFGSLSLDLTGEGTQVDISLDPVSLNFGTVSLGQNNSLDLVVSNTGTGTMQVTNITSDNEQFTVEETSFTIGTNDSYTISVSFAPTLNGVSNGTLTIYSDDPDEPTVTVDLVGNGVTNISGDVNGIWLASNSPYYIVGNANVPNSESLTIENGSRIIFNGDYIFTVEGSLFFDGYEDSTIFTAISGTPEIHISSADNEVEFRNCYFGPVMLDVVIQEINNFETESDLIGWSTTSNYDMGISTDNPHSGNYCMRLYQNNSSEYRIYSQNYVCDENGSPRIDYYVRFDWYNYWDYTGYVYLNNITTGTQTSLEYYDHDEESWTNKIFDLSPYVEPGESFNIEFYNYAWNWSYFYLDDFTITGVEDYSLTSGLSVDIHSSDVAFKDSKIIDSPENAIYINPGQLSLDNTQILNSNGYGIYSDGSSSNINFVNQSKISDANNGIIIGSYNTLHIEDSEISNISNYGINIINSNSQINLINSSISDIGNDAVYSSTSYNDNNVNMHQTIIKNISGDGIYLGSSDSEVIVDSSTIENCSQDGIQTYYSNSPITVSNTIVKNCDENGLYTNGENSIITVNNSRIIDNGYSGIYSSGSNAGARVVKSKILNNGYHGVYASQVPLICEYNLIANNGTSDSYRPIFVGGGSGSEVCKIHFSTIIDNYSYSYFGNNVDVSNTIMWNNNSGSNQYTGSLSSEYSTIQNFIGYDPEFIDTLGHVSSSSPTIDAADPYYSDNYFPPGQGQLRADQGIYGGPDNNIWGEGNPDTSGEPAIHHIVDLPQDQGGFVGIQYQGSAFDYENYAYNITEYQFWREMDLSRTSVNPDTSIETISYNRDSYWEYVGSMQSQGFENYGYSAPTLGDSTASSGIFWSKFLVIAVSSQGETFHSEPDSGYSVDNIAPYAPSVLYGDVGNTGELVASWDVPENEDVVFYEIFKNGELFVTTEEPVFSDQISLGSENVYNIRGVDENDNIGGLSEDFIYNYGTLGDITWDGNIDILDIIQISSIILLGESEYSFFELWASDVNLDEIIDIFDLVSIVDIIMNYSPLNRKGVNDPQSYVYIKNNIVFLNSNVSVRGMQLEFEKGLEGIINENQFQISSIDKKVIIYSIDETSMVGEELPLFSIQGENHISSVTGAGYGGQSISISLEMVPDKFTVYQNYPNPFNPSTTIKIENPINQEVSVVIYDISGKTIKALHESELAKGFHAFQWNGVNEKGVNVSSGLYIISVRSKTFSKTIKAMLLQ